MKGWMQSQPLITFLMESLKIQTTLLLLSFSHPISLINLKAPDMADPAEPPTNNPSLLMSLLDWVNDSGSWVLIQWSTYCLSQVLGTKSYPIPSTLFIGNLPLLSSWGMAKILPQGSTQTILVWGDFYFIFLETPVNVPPVPAPSTTASTLPSHWYNISSASWS